MKKIGSVTPIWNQEMFIKPHMEMLSGLYRNVVLLQKGPLPNYSQHGIGATPDLSEEIIRALFPNVEVYTSNYDPSKDFAAELYNEGLRMMQDCDLVLRLDPDMFFTIQDWSRFITVLNTQDAACYRMDFAKDSINYYMSWDYNHGLKDAKEMDPLAVDPKYMFEGILDYRGQPQGNISIGGWICHHLRGWNKPKSVPANWHESDSAKRAFEAGSNNGKWYTMPEEIKQRLESWRVTLEELKS